MKTGLHDRITATREELTRQRAIALDPERGPATTYTADEAVGRLERELEPLCRDAHVGESAAADLERILEKLRECGQTRDLVIAIAGLENVEFRLRRHLGANPH